MKQRSLLLVVSLSLLILTGLPAQMSDDLQEHPACSYCGMKRPQFAHSRMLIVYDDGSTVGTCSLHCAAVDLALKLDRTPKTIQVGDYKTSKLITAESATWVVGGNKPGVMTKRPKWAFENKADAEAFVKENGGALASFDEAMRAAYEDMYSDTKMIREKRAMRRKAEGREQPGMGHPSH